MTSVRYGAHVIRPVQMMWAHPRVHVTQGTRYRVTNRHVKQQVVSVWVCVVCKRGRVTHPNYGTQ